MAQTTTQRALIFLLRETVGDILLFPIWWYTTGMVRVAKKLLSEWVDIEEWLSLRILLKNMFRPMFADYSKTGRLISFGLRVFLVTTKGLVLVAWTVIELVLMAAWIIVPALALGLFIRQLIPPING